MQRPPSQTGFTLIELLAVIALFGILASIVFALISSASAKAKDARRQSDLTQLKLAMEFYFDDHGNFPPPTQGTNGGDTSSGSSGDHEICGNDTSDPNWQGFSGAMDLVTNGYIASLPKDPINSVDYCYRYVVNDDTKGACVWALLENGKKVGAVAGDPDPAITTGFPQGYACNFMNSLILGGVDVGSGGSPQGLPTGVPGAPTGGGG